MAEIRWFFEGIIAPPAAISWVQTTKNAKIMAIFEHSLTLIREDGRILSLVTEFIGPGPFSMVVRPDGDYLAANAMSILDLSVGEPVLIGEQGLVLDRTLVDVTKVTVWNPQPNWSSMSTKIFKDNASELKNLLVIHGPDGSMADLFTHTGLSPTHQLVKDLWPDLATGLGERKLEDYSDQLRLISGLGSGLTPAGDDFLLGIMMAIWGCLPFLDAKRLTNDILEASIGRTTTLSSAWLDAAAKGEAAYYWHNLIGSMISGNRGEFSRCGRQIIGVGHTSGADALTGFYLAGEILSQDPNPN